MIVQAGVVSQHGGAVSTEGVRWSYYDVQSLRAAGATSLVALNVIFPDHSDTAPLVALFGIRAGLLMNGDSDLISLPCPPYCGKNPRTFEDALADITG